LGFLIAAIKLGKALFFVDQEVAGALGIYRLLAWFSCVIF
jgi:hypothetical protein